MGETCCKAPVAIIAPHRQGANLLRADMPRPPRPIPNIDAHCFAPSRTKIWELPEQVHCSIIGTCLTTHDLRKVLTKLGMVCPGDTDHDLHGRAVGLAGQNSIAAKQLQKRLDAQHDLAIRQFGRVDSEAEIQRLWQAAMDRGDITGPYWALLTHPSASYTQRRDAFGHVHMLSHLVGAANRADIRRLAAFETALATSEALIEQQQDQLQSIRAERDAAIREMHAAMAAKPAVINLPALPQDTGLQHRLDAEVARRKAVESRLALSEQARARDRKARIAADADRFAAVDELAAVEAVLASREDSGSGSPLPRMDGRTLLYVGGRPHQVTALRTLSQGLGASLQHHDGGVDEQIGLLAGLVSRADSVFFPVDCVSHEAALAIKRLCRQAGKPFIPLRSAGQGAFLAAIGAAHS